MNRARFLGLFVDEARQHLSMAYRDLEHFESHPQQPHTLQSLMRHCHSMKGMASTMDFEPFVEMAHRMESLLRELERRPRIWSGELTPLFQAGLNHLHEWIEALAEGREPERDPDADSLIARFDAVLGHRASGEEASTMHGGGAESARWWVRLALEPSEASPTRRIVSTLRSIGTVGRVVRVRPPQLPLVDAPTAMELELELTSEHPERELRRRLCAIRGIGGVELTSRAQRTLSTSEVPTPVVWTRVPADSLDWIADTVRELAVLDATQARGSTRGEDAQTRYLLRRLYDRVSEMRLVPAASLGHRLEPAVRDAARRDGKRVRFSMRGGEIGMERSLLDRLVGPLRHMVRNAAVHGIETSEERIAAGKPAAGCIDLEFRRHADRLELTLSDDGRGVDIDALRRAAVAANLIDSRSAKRLSEREVLELAFLPSVTTRPEADRVAGRGAGLDVVSAELEELDARIELSSEAGRGTRFVVELPLQKAVVQTLVFSREGRMFGIPVDAVRRAMSTSDVPEQLKIIDLADGDDAPPRNGFLLELDQSERRAAVLADEVLGRHDLWLQPLARSVSSSTYVTGAAILERGDLALILDPERLVAEA